KLVITQVVYLDTEELKISENHQFKQERLQQVADMFIFCCSLCVGGVRSYNQQNLYSMKAMEKFKFFIGYQNWVCMNMCINTDGFKEDLRVSNANELQTKVLGVMQDYNAEMHLMEMKELTYDYL